MPTRVSPGVLSEQSLLETLQASERKTLQRSRVSSAAGAQAGFCGHSLVTL